MAELAEHSPLGGSGAYRWIPCPGSVKLSYGVGDLDDEFSLPGQQAHTLAEHCLNTGQDAWQLVRDDTFVDTEMANAVQVYLNAVRPMMVDSDDISAIWGEPYWVELKFHCLSIHEYFWGKADFACYLKTERELHVWDYKHGAGIVVEVVDNPQLKYYGVGVLTHLKLWGKVNRVVLHIAQPRGFHFDGPLRSWAISTIDLGDWLVAKLIPAMNRALVSDETASGEHCRFCPARRMACPQLVKDFNEIEELLVEFSEKDSADELSNEQVGRFLALFDVAKIAAKAANKTAFNRMTHAGALIPGRKLVRSKSDREWKDGAETAIARKFGAKSMLPGKFKSPAQIEELPGGETYAARWAFKPDKGFTVASDADSRPVVARDIKSLFAKAK